MIAALIDGQTDPGVLAQLVHGRIHTPPGGAGGVAGGYRASERPDTSCLMSSTPGIPGRLGGEVLSPVHAFYSLLSIRDPPGDAVKQTHRDLGERKTDPPCQSTGRAGFTEANRCIRG